MSVIIVIDDEAPNLSLIEEYLDGCGHTLKCFTGAAAALAHLESGAAADAILLDRMMPDMDGLAFMRALKALSGHGMVPVILQTAAAMPSQIAEGILAGAYYYLTKPYSAEVVRAVLARALTDQALFSGLQDHNSRISTAAQQIRLIEMTFRSPADVDNISSLLAPIFPNPQAALIGLYELMLNAVEHGNLAIGYAEKTELLRAGSWQAEIERRLALPENLTKQGLIRLQRDAAVVVVTIEDQGAGFDSQRYLQFDAARARHPHGRGIAMARMASFDDIRYVAPGNKVVGTRKLPVAAS